MNIKIIIYMTSLPLSKAHLSMADMADPLKSPLAGPVMDRPYQGTCRAQRSWVSGLRNVCSSQNLQLHNWAVIRTGKTVQKSQSSQS